VGTRKVSQTIAEHEKRPVCGERHSGKPGSNPGRIIDTQNGMRRLCPSRDLGSRLAKGGSRDTPERHRHDAAAWWGHAADGGYGPNGQSIRD
jgi:hypothetical protein